MAPACAACATLLACSLSACALKRMRRSCRVAPGGCAHALSRAAAAAQTPVLGAAVIVGREIAMSALRELAAARGSAAHSAVAVSAWGKWKTATQARWGPQPRTSLSHVLCTLFLWGNRPLLVQQMQSCSSRRTGTCTLKNVKQGCLWGCACSLD